MRRGRRAAVLIAIVALAGAFAGGLWLGRQTAPIARQGTPGEAAQSAELRNAYSPRLLHDPAFVKAQRDNAAALEAECRRNGEFCAEARAARKWLADAGVPD